MKVGDWMTTDVVTLERNDELTVADQVMSLGRVRHMPVLDEDGALVGILSQRDLFHSALVRALGHGRHATERMLAMIPVKEAMTTDVVTTTPDTDLREAAATMARDKIGCLPVLEGGRVVGILTEGDFVARAAQADP